MSKKRVVGILVVSLLVLGVISVVYRLNKDIHTEETSIDTIMQYCQEHGLEVLDIKLLDKHQITRSDLQFELNYDWSLQNKFPNYLIEKELFIFKLRGKGFDTDSEEYRNNINEKFSSKSKEEKVHLGYSNVWVWVWVVNNEVIGGISRPAMKKTELVILGGGTRIPGISGIINYDEWKQRWLEEIENLKEKGYKL